MIAILPPTGGDDDDDGGGGGGIGQPNGGQLAASNDEEILERRSGIRIGRCTNYVKSLPALFEVHPFIPLRDMANNPTPQSSTIAVVVRRFDPKSKSQKAAEHVKRVQAQQTALGIDQSVYVDSRTAIPGEGRHATYGVVKLWDLVSSTQVSLLLTNDAFIMHHHRLEAGRVVWLSGLETSKGKGGGGASTTASDPSRSGGGDKLLRLASASNLKVLGMAKQLGRCKATKNSGEPCGEMVNVDRLQYCSYHLSHAKKDLRTALGSPSFGTSSPSGGAKTAKTQGGGSAPGSIVTASLGHRGGVVIPGAGQPKLSGVAAPSATRTRSGGAIMGTGSGKLNLGSSPFGVRRPATAATSGQQQQGARGEAAPSALTSKESFIVCTKGMGGEVVQANPERSRASCRSGDYAGVDQRPLRPVQIEQVAQQLQQPREGVGHRGQVLLGAVVQTEKAEHQKRALLEAERMTGGGATRHPSLASTVMATNPATASTVAGSRKRERPVSPSPVPLAPRTALTKSTVPPTTSTSTVLPPKRPLPPAFAPLKAQKDAQRQAVQVAARGQSALAAQQRSASNALMSVQQPSPSPPLLPAGGKVAAAPPSSNYRKASNPFAESFSKIVNSAATAEGSSRGSTSRRQEQPDLVALAMNTKSANERLCEVDDQLQRDKKIDALVSQEDVWKALDEIKEKPVSALFCTQCDRFYNHTPAACTSKGHQLESKETIQRWYKCDICGHHIAHLGERHPYHVHCPRCSKAVTWTLASAAPRMKLYDSVACHPSEYDGTELEIVEARREAREADSTDATYE